jgi:hypothetical protein
MSTTPPKLLVLGGHSSGKTTYRTQLYQRVENQDGELHLVKSVGNMEALQSDLERLVQGLQPLHTHVDTYHTTTMLLEDSTKRQLSLEFADYGGEQVTRISDSNVVSVPWIERAQQSSCWLFFLRIDQIRPTKSFMTNPVQTEPTRKAFGGVPASPERSEEINAIETLQRLLFVRNASLRHQLNTPRLGILLSCWDELAEPERKLSPDSLLAQRAPLFSKFVSSNWKPQQFKVWGLSSVEQKLPEDNPDVEFARKGPENIGYIICSKREKCNDLTIPINWLMQPV